jgi:hypothetical protein
MEMWIQDHLAEESESFFCRKEVHNQYLDFLLQGPQKKEIHANLSQWFAMVCPNGGFPIENFKHHISLL